VPRKIRGAKTASSDVVATRLDKKLLFAVRIAAQSQNRFISNYIETVLAQAVKKQTVDESEGDELTAWDIADRYFEYDEGKRLLALWTHHSHLLTQHEARLVELVLSRTPFRVKPLPGAGKQYDHAALVDWDAVHEHWNTLNKVAAGELPESRLPAGKIWPDSMNKLKGRNDG